MIFIGLGSSVGNAETTFKQAKQFLIQAKVEVLSQSKLMKNPPYGGVAKNEFTNAVWQIYWPETTWEKINWVLLPQKRRHLLKARKLLKLLQQCETSLGRTRNSRWDDRTLDLDLLMYCDLEHHSKKLIIPHPEIPKRNFVLKPWSEVVDKNFQIPKFGKLSEMLRALG